MVLVSCKICGKQVNRKPSELKNKSGFSFCSLKCAGKYGAGLAFQRKKAIIKAIEKKAPHKVQQAAKEAKRVIDKAKLIKENQTPVPDKVHWVNRDHRPINPIAREAWDRRILAGEIREYPPH